MRKFKLLRDFMGYKKGKIFYQHPEFDFYAFDFDDNGMSENWSSSEIVENCPYFFQEILNDEERWKPKPGDTAWKLADNGTPYRVTLPDSYLDNLLEFGNCFPTKEIAEKAKSLIQKTLADYRKTWEGEYYLSE